MLFYPGAISQTIATILFFAIIIGGGYASVRIWYQNQKIDALETKVAKYERIISVIDQKESFYKKNLEIIKKNCARERPKPVVSGGKLDVDNLFDKEPM